MVPKEFEVPRPERFLISIAPRRRTMIELHQSHESHRRGTTMREGYGESSTASIVDQESRASVYAPVRRVHDRFLCRAFDERNESERVSGVPSAGRGTERDVPESSRRYGQGGRDVAGHEPRSALDTTRLRSLRAVRDVRLSRP